MANNTYIVPTKNLQDWKEDKIKELILEEFPQFEIDGDDIRYKGRIVTQLVYGDSVEDMLDYDRDIKWLNDEGMSNLAIALEELKKLNPDLNNIVSTRHTPFHVEKNSIDMFLKDYFGAYVFDEGIHPEFIPPDYVSKMTLKYKKDNSIIKKFGDYFKNK